MKIKWSYKRELCFANTALEFCCWDTETQCIGPYGLVGNARVIKVSRILNQKGKICSEPTQDSQIGTDSGTNS